MKIHYCDYCEDTQVRNEEKKWGKNYKKFKFKYGENKTLCNQKNI